MFAGEEQTHRAGLFHRVMTRTMLLASVVLTLIMFAQPVMAVRALIALGLVNALGFSLLAANRRGSTRAASIGLVVGLITMVSVLALSAGGIRSPGMTMSFVFVLMAGLLLGQRAGVIAAVICAGIGLGYVLLEFNGGLPVPRRTYTPVTLWLLDGLDMGLVLVLLRLATDAMSKALARAESEIVVRRQAEDRLVSELAERKRAELEREQLVHALRERVKDLRLLHAAARLLQSTRPFDRTVLEELVMMMPPAWLHQDCCEARITYRDIHVSTPDWRDTPWRLTATFTTSESKGTVEVVYLTAQPPAIEGVFLAEERALIDSIAEMLGAYLEHDFAERQRNRLEAQLRQSQKMQALGTLAGGIAHDFNNLLTAIGANTDLALIDPDVTPSVKECLTEVHNAHARARDLVQRIVLFSRRQESQREPVVLTTVVDEAVRLLRASLPPMIDITFRAAPNLPHVLADASQMHQLIMNLGTNAGQAMPDGGTLTITLDVVAIGYGAASPASDLHPGPHVSVSVADTGTGISPEIRHRLFEPFFTTKGVAGTGLGLSVVHGIVADHGGAITVESETGHGTTFRVYFPVTESTGRLRAPTAPGIVHGQGEHIMYVDDEEALVVVMTRLLTQLGYRCTGYSDANAALHAFRSNADDFDAVVTDMAMPRLTGVALAAAMRDLRPDVRIALVSGYEGQEIDVEPGRAGFTMRLSKPVGIEALSQAMRTLVQTPSDSRPVQSRPSAR